MPDKTKQPRRKSKSKSDCTTENDRASSLYTKTYQWFDDNNWTLFEFQQKAWDAWHQGESGLIHSPTGSGKTLAAWLGPVQHAAAENVKVSGLNVLWLTPLRALANDTCKQLQQAADKLTADTNVALRVETRTGDTSSSKRAKQKSSPPFALITTPESLSVMLSYADGGKSLSKLHTVVVDEWHELIGSKRGVQTQLCLARLKKLCPQLRIWGVSATLANLDQAMDTLIGHQADGRLIQGVIPKSVVVDSILPQDNQRFRWSGHLGVELVKQAAEVIDGASTSLVFTNTRSQAEIWFKSLLEHKPEWLDSIALHHGSLDKKLRQAIEDRLRTGDIRCVVCTSSLDLGVDFSPVDQVLQIGSPKGVARLLQRAGRSGHQPGAVSRVVCVPTHAFELVEIASVRSALEERRIESRRSPLRCHDVLSQHLVTIALGGGFEEAAMLAEVKTTYAYQSLSNDEWQWVLDFITRGGQALQGYPQYHKVVLSDATYRVKDKTIALRHRMAIGTINSDAQINVVFQRGKRLGTTEENFIARLKPGDIFQFAGKRLELRRVADMTAYVKLASGKKTGAVPRWWGTQMPISTELADSVLRTLVEWKQKTASAPELDCVGSMLELQQQWSVLPGPNDLLIELIQTREGYSMFCYPFAGRLAHEGLAMLVANRLSAKYPLTVTLQINDYGFELQCAEPIDVCEDNLKELFTADNLVEDILTSVNSGEIARRQFRDIARIAGLVFQGYPGSSKTTRQVQASSGLIFDVLEKYDSGNLLVDQARREVLEQQLEIQRLKQCLLSIKQRKWHICTPERLTPLAFPLWAESVQSQTYSSEKFQTRVERMLGTLEKAAAESLD